MGSGDGWGGGETWGENGDNYMWTTIKKKKLKKKEYFLDKNIHMYKRKGTNIGHL